MSWAEDMGYDAYSLEDLEEWREEDWKDGIHTDRNDNKLKLSEMSNQHLQNIIDYFEHLDTKPLKDELKRRNKLGLLKH